MLSQKIGLVEVSVCDVGITLYQNWEIAPFRPSTIGFNIPFLFLTSTHVGALPAA